MIKINLKKILKEKKMTLKELSELTGISTTSLGALANGKSNGIQFNTLEKVLIALEIDIEELIKNVNSIFSLRLVPTNVQEHILDQTLYRFHYTLVGHDLDTNQSEELPISVNIVSTNNAIRKVNLFSYEPLQEDSEKSYLALNLCGGNSSLLKALDFLIVHDVNTNNRLQQGSLDDLYLFDYSLISIGKYLDGFRTTLLGNDTSEPLLDFIEYVADPGIDEIIFDEDNKFECINVFL
ncbi:helix-turn-helix transcriptional regulator [Lysinibacillus telephonicus]|uniref:helix-turn-helix domain-containing protein n=1 Tax=Lysinibacillus telephonicus TaxID=1714840 RepID=UPI00163A0CF2|nr:helix-turn-helix transcriptional regulator [Lysinibacillus telephonicus]